MFPTHLIYQAANTPIFDGIEDLSGNCFVCKQFILSGIPIKKALRDCFAGLDSIGDAKGVGYCAACAFTFLEKVVINGDIKRFRTHSHLVANGKWMPCTKAQKPLMREFLLSDHNGPWLAVLAESGQKFLAWRAPVNFGNGPFKVRLEEQNIETNKEELTFLIDLITTLLTAGFSKSAIQSGVYNQNTIKKNYDLYTQAEPQLKEFRGQSVLDLALYLSQKEEWIEPIQQAEGEVINVRNNGKSSRSSISDPPLDELEYMGKEASQVLADTRGCDQGSSVYNDSKQFRQLNLFEDVN